jgi:hypothetical protein
LDVKWADHLSRSYFSIITPNAKNFSNKMSIDNSSHSSPVFPPEDPAETEELNFDLNFDSVTFLEVLTGQNMNTMAQDIRGLLELIKMFCQMLGRRLKI